jgi:hypothetical protein
MEDVVQMGTLRELQPICHMTDALRQLEWPKVFWSKLVAVGDVKGRSRPVNEVKPNPLIDIEREVSVVLIVEVLVALLRMLQAVTDF